MRLLAVLLLLVAGVTAQSKFGAYFVDWAQYRPEPYTHTPSNLAPIINRVDEIMYSFVYFCPPAGTNPMPYWAIPPYASCTDSTEYQLIFTDSKDPQFVQQINNYKSSNPNLKVLVSIGGWNFPSAYFSMMVSSSTNRQKFITSAQSFMQQYGFDGIDIDWEYPCSPARENSVEISCTDFDYVADAGGNCPADATNFPTLLQEMRQAWGTTKIITAATQAAHANEIDMDLGLASQYVDWFHAMTYDYQVSDLTSDPVMSPNEPFNMPPQPAIQMSVNDTIRDYLSQGVPASKILLGIAFYGHTWYQPSFVNTNNWQKFGASGVVEGLCCGPFTQTYGGKPGQGCSMCGTMMFSEITFGKPSYYYDNQTQSAIGFWNTLGADNYTPAGTWISYNDPTSVTYLTKWAMNMGLKGVFCYDTSMDTVTSSGTFTYQLMNTIANTMGGH